MKHLGVLGLAVFLASSGVASGGDGEVQLAWQMGTAERGYTEDFGERSLTDPQQDSDRGSPFGSGTQSDPYGPGSRGSVYEDPLRRPPNLGGSYGGPYNRPWTGRGCNSMGGGRTCF